MARRPRDPATATGVMLLLGGLLLGYLASRATGIPVLDPEPEAIDAVGVATTLVEATGLVFALWLMQPMGRQRPAHLQEVSR